MNSSSLEQMSVFHVMKAVPLVQKGEQTIALAVALAIKG